MTTPAEQAKQQQLKELFETKLALDAKRVTDTLKNAQLSERLCAIAAVAGVTVDSAAPADAKALGNALYSVATEFPAKAAVTSRDLVVRMIVAKKLVSKLQLLAAYDFAGKHPEAEVTEATLEKACGVGVTVSAEEIEAAVKAEAEAHPGLNLGELMRAFKTHERMKWADPTALRACAEKYAKKNNAAQAKEKPAAAATTSQAKAEEKELVEDPSLPQAVRAKIRDLGAHEGKRVHVFGWAHHVRAQKNIAFIDLRDGSGFLQCVLAGKHIASETRTATILREASLEVTGTLKAPPAGQHTPENPQTCPFELQVDWWRLVGPSSLDLEKLVTAESSIPQRFDQRHIIIRGTHTSSFLKLRSQVLHCFRDFYFSHNFTEVQPPTIVQTQCEGGSDLFSLQYFGEPAYLTQSSQLYLETVIPAVGDAFCCLSSYRAEQSRTPRHLSEYTHLEAEMPFISFEDLLHHLEDLVVGVCEDVVKRFPELLMYLNPKFTMPTRPFMRMTYHDAIEFCRAHNILNTETGKPFEHGEDITERPERAMCALIGRPVFMTRFPAEMKAFYMSRPADDRSVTESVDLLMPGVGEIVGGSMRIHDYAELMAAYDRVKINPAPYYWFTDQRKYGTCPHGGYGLGVERFLMWMVGDDHIRNMCLYPRHIQRCQP
eukprot:TRINITY_DN17535_c0_g1_i1.p1 TRINITY_DN17535_c0_g1~~TRINITY_DN17535_c0_g1_i1.p1  ORF type:complete len:659 (-),score=219.88 TRINITY_DN17535_c0_g1_i1:83-2059(-)